MASGQRDNVYGGGSGPLYNLVVMVFETTNHRFLGVFTLHVSYLATLAPTIPVEFEPVSY